MALVEYYCMMCGKEVDCLDKICSNCGFEFESDKEIKLTKEVERLNQENEKLKEALKKCCPTKGFGNCYSCGLRFDKIFEHGHAEDCEYIKLCGEGGEK